MEIRRLGVSTIALVVGFGCEPKGPSGNPAASPPVASHEQPEHGHHGEARPHDDQQHGHAMHHRFENAEAWAEKFDSPERAAWQKPDEVVTLLQLPDDADVADIGAGTGYFAVRLAAAVPRGSVIATDIEPDMVSYLKARAQREGASNLRAVQSDPSRPSLEAPVDLVFVCNVYHHIEDRAGFFGSLAESLRPGGRLVIVDFEPNAPDDAPGPPKKHRVGIEALQSQLEPAGYVLVQAERELLPYQYVAIFERVGID